MHITFICMCTISCSNGFVNRLSCLVQYSYSVFTRLGKHVDWERYGFLAHWNVIVLVIHSLSSWVLTLVIVGDILRKWWSILLRNVTFSLAFLHVSERLTSDSVHELVDAILEWFSRRMGLDLLILFHKSLNFKLSLNQFLHCFLMPAHLPCKVFLCWGILLQFKLTFILLIRHFQFYRYSRMIVTDTEFPTDLVSQFWIWLINCGPLWSPLNVSIHEWQLIVTWL